MSKSTTPATVAEDADRDPLDRPAGRRFTGNQTILDAEAELAADGVDLPNRAIPIADHAELGDELSAEDIRARIDAEADKDQPNRNRIGYLNHRLEGLQ